MWKYAMAFLIVSAAGHAAVQVVTPKDMADTPPPSMTGSASQSYMIIPPAARALDYQQAFEMLRKEKSTGKVYIQLADGSTLANVIDMTLLPNSTLFLFRFNSPQGIRFQVVKVEDILTIGYSS